MASYLHPTPTPPIGDGGITSNAPQWGRWEQQLTASQSSHNPVTDVALRITYSGPNGQTFQSQGFWDGGSTFVVRAMFPTIGTWTWQTQATSGDSGLTQHGTVQVSAGTGTTLQTNGALKISSDGHNLTYADGTHFFWLGDTVWDAPLRASETEWQQYLRDRTSKGFSVVQISLAPTWSAANDVQGNRPFVNDDLRRPNPTFWQMFDRKVQLANDAGLAVLVVGLMDPLDQGQSDYAVAQLMGRYIAARLAGNHVIFSPSFDLPYWDMADETAKAIREVAPNHLITQHPGTPSGQPTNVWSEQYFAQPYLNIAGLQTGHNGGDRNLVFGQAVTWTRSLAQRQPAKTVINLEAYYDTGGLVSDGGGAHQGTAWDARATAYLSLLSGASGYTYGAYGIYIWNGKPFHPLPWQTALNFDSSPPDDHPAHDLHEPPLVATTVSTGAGADSDGRSDQPGGAGDHERWHCGYGLSAKRDASADRHGWVQPHVAGQLGQPSHECAHGDWQCNQWWQQDIHPTRWWNRLDAAVSVAYATAGTTLIT